MGKVLIIGRHQSILNNVLSQVKNEGYNAIGATDNDTAIKMFEDFMPDAVIIGGGVDTDSRNLFRTRFKRLKPKVTILEIHPQFILEHLKRIFT